MPTAHISRGGVSMGQATAEETEGGVQGCLRGDFRASSSFEMLQFSDRLYFPKMATREFPFHELSCVVTWPFFH